MSGPGGFEPRRIIVVVTRQIGDVLLTTPLISAAKARWPNAEIDVLGMAGTLDVLAGHPAVSSCIDVGAIRSWRDRIALVRRLWRRWDLALIGEASDRAHLLGFIAAPVRSGLVPQTRSHAWWKRPLLRHAVTVAGIADRHIAAEKVALLDPWIDAEARKTIVTPPASKPLPDDLARAIGAAPVVIHVPSMWRYKQWPIANYERVVRALVDDGRQVVLTGGPGEGDRAMVARVAAVAGSPRVVDASGRLDFGQLAGLLARAALYIGPDTSVTHLAASTGVPVIALFGPTVPTRWGPIGSGGAAPPFVRIDTSLLQRRGDIVLLQGPGSCVPCGRAGCEDHHGSVSECLEAITPERVIAQARALLAERAARAGATPGDALSRAPASGA